MTQTKASSSPHPGHGPLADGSSTDGHAAIAPSISGLGSREREVLSVLGELGSATVQQVAGRLSATLAYTTVMTTLDRLFRKGLLQRKKQNRAFVYSTTLSARELEGQRAAHFIRRFFSESDRQPDLLVSCLVDAVHQYDTDLLDRLASSIQKARAQSQPGKPATEKSEVEKENDR